MKFLKFLPIFCLFFIHTHSLALKDISEMSAYASECMIKHKVNPLTVKRLKDGDLSKNDEKNQVQLVEIYLFPLNNI